MKNYFRILWKYISKPSFRFSVNSDLGFYKSMDDEIYLKRFYKLLSGQELNIHNPQTFNEKLNWLKLYDRKDLYTKLADKYEVKSFVTDIIGEEYVVPNFGVFSSVEQIKWDELPEKFVLKATHDSSGAVICRNKNDLNIKRINATYRKILRRNYYYAAREWPYKNIKPRVIIDKFLEDGTGTENGISLRDYKFWCFNGVPKYIYCTVKDEKVYENFYDLDFNPIDINHGFPRHSPEFDKPKNFEKMVELAGKLAVASQTSCVRVDFFNVNGNIYFGEFTFYDWAGLRPFTTPEQDLMLGKMIQLPD